VEVRRIATKEMLDPWLAGVPIVANSDYYPVLDQNAARARFLLNDALDFVALAAAPVPALELLGVQPTVAHPTKITPYEHYPVSQSHYAARVLRDKIADHSIEQLREMAANDKVAGVPRRVAMDCAEPALRGDKISAMFNVGTDVVPYLQAGELVSVWRWVETQPCGSQLNSVESEWLALFKAVGSRNPKQMAERAEHLLQGDGSMTPQRTRYLVMVAMLGHIAQKDKAAASQLWSRYGAKIQSDPQSQMLFRILAAHSAAP